MQIYGLPSAGNAHILSPGEKEIRGMLDYTSNYVGDENAVESITLDGETARVALHGRYGVSKKIARGVFSRSATLLYERLYRSVVVFVGCRNDTPAVLYFLQIDGYLYCLFAFPDNVKGKHGVLFPTKGIHF